jgi:hypothetical protein
VRSIAPAISSGLEAGIETAGLTTEQANQLRGSLKAAVAQALDKVQGEQTDLEQRTHRAQGRRAVPAGGYDALLDVLAGEASGLQGKEPIKVEVVSPSIDPAVKKSPSEQLAGAFFFHFGGFFDERFRQSDFALGFRNMTYWLTNCLPGYLPGVDLSVALAAVADAYTHLGWEQVDFGGVGLKALSHKEKDELLALAFHVAHVVEHDVTHGGA